MLSFSISYLVDFERTQNDDVNLAISDSKVYEVRMSIFGEHW